MYLIIALTAMAAFAAGLWSGRARVETPASSPLQTQSPPGAETPSGENQIHLSAEAIRRGNIETAECRTTRLEESLELTGRLAINEENAARVGAFVGGRVRRILATVGDLVKQGQPLVYIHSHELRDARAAEEKALARVAEREKALVYAKAERERAERLLAAKALSIRERAQSLANETAAASELEQARAELTRASDFLEHLVTPADSPEDVVVLAPLAGVVLKRDITLGGVVNEGEELMSIANLNSLWAIAEAPQHMAAAVRTGQPVDVAISAFGDAKFSGKIVHIGETLDPQMRTIMLRALIHNPRGQLRPEMYASISIHGANANGGRPAVVVSRDAVQDFKGEPVVFLALGNGVFEKRSVRTGREKDGRIEILDGLQSGERVVTQGGFLLKSELLKGTISDE
jgi:membrane fusion protein, heavy metal efflux system